VIFRSKSGELNSWKKVKKLKKNNDKKSKNASFFEQKAEKMKKKLQNDSFYCVFSVKIAWCFQFGRFSGPWDS